MEGNENRDGIQTGEAGEGVNIGKSEDPPILPRFLFFTLLTLAFRSAQGVDLPVRRAHAIKPCVKSCDAELCIRK